VASGVLSNKRNFALTNKHYTSRREKNIIVCVNIDKACEPAINTVHVNIVRLENHTISSMNIPSMSALRGAYENPSLKVAVK
jgi:hypothetical protein